MPLTAGFTLKVNVTLSPSLILPVAGVLVKLADVLLAGAASKSVIVVKLGAAIPKTLSV